jgi:hypothetical protein
MEVIINKNHPRSLYDFENDERLRQQQLDSLSESVAQVPSVLQNNHLIEKRNYQEWYVPHVSGLSLLDIAKLSNLSPRTVSKALKLFIEGQIIRKQEGV